MDPGQWSTSAIQQQHDKTTGQSEHEITTTSQSVTGNTEHAEFLLDVPDTMNSQLLGSDGPHNSLGALLSHHSLGNGQSPHLVETTTHADCTTNFFEESAMQAGRWLQPQSVHTQSHSYALPPSEQVNWLSTIDDIQPAQALTGTPGDSMFEVSSMMSSIQGHHPLPGSYMLPGANASTPGYGTPFETFGGSTVLRQASQITPITNHGLGPCSSSYDAWSMMLQPQATVNVPAFGTFTHEPDPFTAGNQLPCSSLVYQDLQQPQQSMATLPLTPASFNALDNWSVQQESSSFFNAPIQYPDISQQLHVQGSFEDIHLPFGSSYMPGPSGFDGFQTMVGQTTQSGFHQDTDSIDQTANASYPEFFQLPVTANNDGLHIHNGNVTAFVTPSKRLAIEDVSYGVVQASTSLSQKRQCRMQDDIRGSRKPTIDLSSIDEYVNPVIERKRALERRKTQKRTRKVNEKVAKACFVCQRLKEKVTMATLHFLLILH
jgi:hypothetical protein